MLKVCSEASTQHPVWELWWFSRRHDSSSWKLSRLLLLVQGLDSRLRRPGVRKASCPYLVRQTVIWPSIQPHTSQNTCFAAACYPGREVQQWHLQERMCTCTTLAEAVQTISHHTNDSHKKGGHANITQVVNQSSARTVGRSGLGSSFHAECRES